MWPWRTKPHLAPSIEDSARHLAEWNALNAREQVKARCRQMRADLGLPPLEALG